jgi:hypothetical protein
MSTPEPVNELLSLLRLARRAREAASIETLGFLMVNETLQLLRYRQAALWLNADLGPGKGMLLGRVAAVSGLPQPNPLAPYTQWLGQLFRAIQKLSRETPAEAGALRVLCAEDFPELADDWAEWLPAHALWIPLKHDGHVAGGLLLAGDDTWQTQQLALAEELASSYAHALAMFAPKRRPVERLQRLWHGTRERRWLLIGLLLVAIFPVQQSVLAPAEVVPKEPFLVRAPQDGVIDRLLVQPNQLVKVGTPLFSLDQRSLQTRYAIASKAYDTAQEEYRQSAQLAVTDDKGKVDLSLRRGTLDEKRLELAYTAEQLGRVQVAAERAGIAVFSDVNDWQGKAVALGERILTLADPSKVELSIHLPVGERFNVAPGAAVSLYPNASPLSAYDAVVTQVAYSAEPVHEGEVAYRLKADFPAGTALPRIGLMGTAKLHGTRVPLIYYALRRPLTSVRQWLGI